MTFLEEPYGELVATTIRVMTWNVWGRFGPWQQRAHGLVETIRDVAADVVLLQEAWCDDAGADQSAVLAAELGFFSGYGGGDLLFGSWGLGNGLLSRWPIRELTTHPLPTLRDGAWGGLTVRAIVEAPHRPILVYNVALDWPPQAGEARAHALRHLVEMITADAEFGRAPLVVGGDFNAAPDSDEIRMLTGRRATAQPGFVLFDAWDWADDANDTVGGATWSNANPWAAPALLPNRRIDYLFAGWPRRGGVGSVVSAFLAGREPLDGVVASDHYAVVADLRA